jgi:hypothetical protein
MASGQRLISWLHPCSTSNVALNTRTCAYGPLMGHPNWVGCDMVNVQFEYVVMLDFLENGIFRPLWFHVHSLQLLHHPSLNC